MTLPDGCVSKHLGACTAVMAPPAPRCVARTPPCGQLAGLVGKQFDLNFQTPNFSLFHLSSHVHLQMHTLSSFPDFLVQQLLLTPLQSVTILLHCNCFFQFQSIDSLKTFKTTPQDTPALNLKSLLGRVFLLSYPSSAQQ